MIEDIFSLKPLIFPADCTGDITLTAEISDLDIPDSVDKSTYTSSLSTYASFGTISVEGLSTFTMQFNQDVSSSTEFSEVGFGTGYIVETNFSKLRYIPAFYSSGNLYIQYSFYETGDPDGEVDLTWDMSMEFPSVETECPWIEGNFATDSQIFKNMIQSDNSEVYFPTINEGMQCNQLFNLSPWNGVPPFVVDWFIDEPATTIAIKRSVLQYPNFHIRITNNLTSTVVLNNAKFTFTFNYSPYDMLMNMRTEGDKKRKQSRIYTLSKGADTTRIENLDYPVYAVVDGYKVAAGGRPPEVVKVFATWNEFHENGNDDYYFPTVVELLPVNGMSGTDYATCLYKSAGYPLKIADFTRIADNGWMNNDGITVIDAPTLAANDLYRIITVTVKDDLDYDNNEAVFVIETVPNDNAEYPISPDELNTYIDTVNFYNVATPFNASVEIPRSMIDPMFYETLWQTYEESPVLESVSGEPLYYIEFSVNDYPTFIPIYNGQGMKFSDVLSHATNGVRSSDIFYMNGKTPNVINVKNTTQHKYKVKFRCDFDVYKGVYVIP